MIYSFLFHQVKIWHNWELNNNRCFCLQCFSCCQMLGLLFIDQKVLPRLHSGCTLITSHYLKNNSLHNDQSEFLTYYPIANMSTCKDNCLYVLLETFRYFKSIFTHSYSPFLCCLSLCYFIFQFGPFSMFFLWRKQSYWNF